MSSTNTERFVELISDAQMAFLSGKYQESFTFAKEAI